MKCSECRASKEMRGGVCLAGIIPYYLKNGAKGCACNSQQIKKYIRDFNPVKTHFDEIKSMSVDELAEWIMREPSIMHSPIGYYAFCPPGMGGDCPTRPCKQCWLDWFKSPAEEGSREE